MIVGDDGDAVPAAGELDADADEGVVVAGGAYWSDEDVHVRCLGWHGQVYSLARGLALARRPRATEYRCPCHTGDSRQLDLRRRQAAGDAQVHALRVFGVAPLIRRREPIVD